MSKRRTRSTEARNRKWRRLFSTLLQLQHFHCHCPFSPMPGLLPPSIRPAHSEEQLGDRENEGELHLPGTYRTNLSPEVVIIVVTVIIFSIFMIIMIIMIKHVDVRPNESFENPRKSRDCWSSGWGADSYEDTVNYIIIIQPFP